MIKQSYEEIVNKIISSTSLNKEEIESLVEKKLKSLQDLISREGAAYIIANELKVKLFDSSPKTLKVQDVMPGMSSLTVTGKIVTINPPKEFKTETRSGKLSSLVIGDETGTIRVVVWDARLIDQISTLKESDIIKIKNAYSKDNRGFNEVHMGNKSEIIINPPDEQIETVKVQLKTIRKEIKDLKEFDFAEIIGTVVQIFEPRYYAACPECNKKVTPMNDAFSCEQHNLVMPRQIPIINLFFDDGTANIRDVCFRDQAAKLIGGESNYEVIKQKNLGRQLKLQGKVVRNDLFDRTEFIINTLEEASPEELIKDLK